MRHECDVLGRTGHIRFAILRELRLYFAGPLFSAAERDWNVELAGAFRAAGHEVFLPQEQEPGKDAAGIFSTDVGGIDWADALVAIMDGPDPDSGTSWEVGYASARSRSCSSGPTSAQDGSGAPYNAMLTEAATIRLDLPESTPAEVRRNDHRGSRAPRDDLACRADERSAVSCATHFEGSYSPEGMFTISRSMTSTAGDPLVRTSPVVSVA